MNFFDKPDLENLMLRFTNILLEISIFIVIIGTLYSLSLYVSDIVFGTTLSHKFGLHQILTLMIFVEIFAMVSKYVESHEVPVEFMGYLVITAIARHVVVDIHKLTEWTVIGLSASVFILIVAISIYKYCIFRSIFSNPE